MDQLTSKPAPIMLEILPILSSISQKFCPYSHKILLTILHAGNSIVELHAGNSRKTT